MTDISHLISVKLQVYNLLNDVISMKPKTECEFNNLLAYAFANNLLIKLNNKLPQYGGKKRKTHLKSNKIKKITNSKTKKHKGGFMFTKSSIIFMMMLILFVNGIQNITDTNVIARIKQANSVSDIFRNNYGTCTLNTLLFLKTIDLPTFTELSIDMMQNKAGMSTNEMSRYLNYELNIQSKWFSFTPRGNTEQELIEDFINKIKKKLISLRMSYGFDSNKSILTAMNYTKKNKENGHSVVLWLTSNDDIILIEPQKFISNNILLYSSDKINSSIHINDNQVKFSSLQQYIYDNIDITNDIKETEIFESIHIEINDIYNKDVFSQTNKNILNAIMKIKSASETM